ncbi:hypothetical protein [Terrarubrum flagellatum]|uniref:hypothetical protein n=1 Tax=Terrirubrum flagellatum TaxID=2895980 RepID=UPI003144EB03
MHILFDISAHGLGHLAQAGPVIEQFATRRPACDLTVRTGLDREILQRRIAAPFSYQRSEDDFGLVMATSFVVDRPATARRYVELHARFDRAVDALAAKMLTARVDMVVANVGYLSLAAAQRAGLRNLAFSSINWRDVVRHYCANEPGVGPVLIEMEACYRRCDAFLRLVPGTAMGEFETTPVDSLVVSVGADRRRELRARLGLGPEQIAIAFSFTDGERQPPPSFSAADARNILCVGPRIWAGRPAWISFEEAGLPFVDLVRSVDLIVAKPGYGIVTEAACAGAPTLLLPRDDWPETSATSEWHQRHGRFETTQTPLPSLSAHELIEAHARLSAKQTSGPLRTDGAETIALTIAALLDQLIHVGA